MRVYVLTDAYGHAPPEEGGGARELVVSQLATPRVVFYPREGKLTFGENPNVNLHTLPSHSEKPINLSTIFQISAIQNAWGRGQA